MRATAHTARFGTRRELVLSALLVLLLVSEEHGL
jgi:hypothetical protein